MLLLLFLVFSVGNVTAHHLDDNTTDINATVIKNATVDGTNQTNNTTDTNSTHNKNIENGLKDLLGDAYDSTGGPYPKSDKGWASLTYYIKDSKLELLFDSQ